MLCSLLCGTKLETVLTQFNIDVTSLSNECLHDADDDGVTDIVRIVADHDHIVLRIAWEIGIMILII